MYLILCYQETQTNTSSIENDFVNLRSQFSIACKQGDFTLLVYSQAQMKLQTFPSGNCVNTVSKRSAPEGVSDAISEVEEVPAVLQQQVSSVEVDIPGFEHVPEQLLLRLHLVPSIAQELVHGCQRSHEDSWLSCAHSHTTTHLVDRLRTD